MNRTTNKGHRKMWTTILILTIIGILLFWSGPARLPMKTPISINVLEEVELNGSKQWVSIRGTDINKPVLLFLHGGPGSANLALLRQQTPELEQYFIVVNWDQRGAGKSVRPFVKESLSAAQLQADTRAMVEYLKTRFNVEKIYLAGFSWGTVLGLSYAAEHPENLYAYIGIGQEVNSLEGERLSFEYVLKEANERNDQKALNELSQVDPAYSSIDWLKQNQIQRKWLLKYGGVYHIHNSYNHEIWSLLTAPEYSFIDFMFWPSGSSNSLEQMFPKVMQIDFFKTISHVDVPVYFLAGRYDYNTPFKLVERYYDQLDAPTGKQLIWFENSAHSIVWDEPKKFAQTLIDIEKATNTGTHSP